MCPFLCTALWLPSAPRLRSRARSGSFVAGPVARPPQAETRIVDRAPTATRESVRARSAVAKPRVRPYLGLAPEQDLPRAVRAVSIGSAVPTLQLRVCR